jgi:hypothetical protein
MANRGCTTPWKARGRKEVARRGINISHGSWIKSSNMPLNYLCLYINAKVQKGRMQKGRVGAKRQGGKRQNECKKAGYLSAKRQGGCKKAG